MTEKLEVATVKALDKIFEKWSATKISECFPSISKESLVESVDQVREYVVSNVLETQRKLVVDFQLDHRISELHQLKSAETDVKARIDLNDAVQPRDLMRWSLGGEKRRLIEEMRAALDVAKEHLLSSTARLESKKRLAAELTDETLRLMDEFVQKPYSTSQSMDATELPLSTT